MSTTFAHEPNFGGFTVSVGRIAARRTILAMLSISRCRWRPSKRSFCGWKACSRSIRPPLLLDGFRASGLFMSLHLCYDLRAISAYNFFVDFTMASRIPFTEYMTKLKSSLVIFNTPAVFGCHGWKLAEFRALGKAIISTPLTRELPSPLEHGTHVHFVDGSIDQFMKLS